MELNLIVHEVTAGFVSLLDITSKCIVAGAGGSGIGVGGGMIPGCAGVAGSAAFKKSPMLSVGMESRFDVDIWLASSKLLMSLVVTSGKFSPAMTFGKLCVSVTGRLSILIFVEIV